MAENGVLWSFTGFAVCGAAWSIVGRRQGSPDMTDTIRFTLDGREVEAQPGQTIWEVAKGQGTTRGQRQPGGST